MSLCTLRNKALYLESFYFLMNIAVRKYIIYWGLREMSECKAPWRNYGHLGYTDTLMYVHTQSEILELRLMGWSSDLVVDDDDDDCKTLFKCQDLMTLGFFFYHTFIFSCNGDCCFCWKAFFLMFNIQGNGFRDCQYNIQSAIHVYNLTELTTRRTSVLFVVSGI